MVSITLKYAQVDPTSYPLIWERSLLPTIIPENQELIDRHRQILTRLALGQNPVPVLANYLQIINSSQESLASLVDHKLIPTMC